MKSFHYILILLVIFGCSHAQESRSEQSSCEWCGATEAPNDVQSQTTIADSEEEGLRIKISGTVFLSDKKTPAEGVILYLYHTNSKGIYPKKGDEKGNGRRHGYLRGWIKTGSDGKYSFETIKPEPYPGRTVPAHIHITVKEPGKDEYWLKDYFFEGDKLLTQRDLKNETGDDKFNHIVSLSENLDVFYGKRDILLKN